MRRSPALILVALLVALTGTLVGPGAEASSTLATQQRQLRYLGCNPGPIDGKPGLMTKAAVIRFQAANSLSQSGRIDTATRQRLSSAKRIWCSKRPIPAKSGSGRRIVIDQSQNWVWLVGSDGRSDWQNGMIDNTGELRPGSYTTGSKCGRAARIRRNTSVSGSVALDYFVRFAPCGIGFHRIPTDRQDHDDQIHPDWWLGTNFSESHGCIRLSKITAAKVWYFTSRGTTKVVVVR